MCKMTKLFGYVCIVLIVLLTVACGERSETTVRERTENEIIMTYSNTSSALSIIESKNNIMGSGVQYVGMRLSDVDKLLHIECLRRVERGYYSIFQDTEGGLLFLLFEKEKDYFEVTDYWHTKGNVNKQSFSQITPSLSTINDVRQVDPYGYEMLSDETGLLPFSTHLTNDGFCVEITYDSESFIVKDLSFNRNESFFPTYLIDIDMQMLY